MASEALSIPIDIPWQRLAWSRDMLDRRGGGLPPRWRSSVTVHSYAVPLEDSAEEYPDSRVIYLKLTASITGWTENEAIPGLPVLPEGLDEWQTSAWDYLWTHERIGEYWPCMTAIAQLAIYPNGSDEVHDDDYPYIVDFEPKKRELYESVSVTGEVVSGSSNNLNVQKGNTTTRSTESEVSAHIGFSAYGVGAGANVSERSMRSSEAVDMTTSDKSIERRETAGRSTQLSQMYQLFNGYHVGTNRGVFVILARPQTVTDAAQVDNNLINGERNLEGIQEIFLVVHVPRAVPGVCVEAWLDTGHKHKLHPSGDNTDFATALIITRRIVTGCATFDGDKIVVERPTTPPPPDVLPPRIVGEFVIDPARRFDGTSPAEFAMRSRDNQVTVANQLNVLQAQMKAGALAAASSPIYTPRPYLETGAFRSRASNALKATRMSLETLGKLGYILDEKEESALISAGVDHSGELFQSAEKVAEIVVTVRNRMLDAVIKAAAKKK